MTDYMFLCIALTVATFLIIVLGGALVLAAPNKFIVDYMFALKTFSRRENAELVAHASETLHLMLSGLLDWKIGGKHLFLTTDPMEDIDDTLLLWTLLVLYELLDARTQTYTFAFPAAS